MKSSAGRQHTTYALRRPAAYRALRVLCLALGLLALAPLSAVAAQPNTSPTVWQAADELNELLFAAQTALLAAERSDDEADRTAAHGAVEQARELFERQLRSQFDDLAPEASERIIEAFSEALVALEEQSANAFAVARGKLSVAIVEGGFTAALSALERGDGPTAREWLRLREYRRSTRVEAASDPAAQAVTEFESGLLDSNAALAAVTADLRDTYFFRLREALSAVEEAAEKEFGVRAGELAGRADGYFQLLRDDIAAQLGEAGAAQLEAEFARLSAHLTSGAWQAVPEQVARLRQSLNTYQPVRRSAAELARRAELLHLYVELTWIEYRDGVRDGQVTIPIEYQEARTFHAQAVTLYEELLPNISAADPAASERLGAVLAELETLIAELGPNDAVQQLSDEALAIIERTLDVSPDAGGDAVFAVIDELLVGLLAAVERGSYDGAERIRIEAYAFFESGPEQRLAHREPTLTRAIEGSFWEGSGGRRGLASLLQNEASPDEVAATVEQLGADLDRAEETLQTQLSTPLAVAGSMVIIVREGLEAVLIVGAILAVLRSSGGAARRFSAWVVVGVVAAVALSLATWFAARRLIEITPANREVIEGVTSLVAVAVLFYVSNWLFHKVYVLDWLTYVRSQVGRAVSSGSALLLAGLGFTVVYREGFETVLFYQALLFDADGGPVLAGFVAGAAVIAVVAVAILKLSKRLPLRWFFTVTGVVMLLLAFNFTGSGVREMQEAGWVNVTWLPWMPESVWLMELFGIYPTLETTLAQLGFLALTAATLALSWQRGRRAAGTVSRAPG